MGSARGSIYAMEHESMSINDIDFWDFSWHEMGYYDIPAQIDFIKNQTKSKGKITYVGHSMSATTALVYAAMRPNHSLKNVNAMILMSPSAIFDNLHVDIAIFLGLHSTELYVRNACTFF